MMLDDVRASQDLQGVHTETKAEIKPCFILLLKSMSQKTDVQIVCWQQRCHKERLGVEWSWLGVGRHGLLPP